MGTHHNGVGVYHAAPPPVGGTRPGPGRQGRTVRRGRRLVRRLNICRRRSDARRVTMQRGDATWQSIVAAAERLNRDRAAHAMHVVAERQRSWTMLTVTEGLAVGDKWTDAFEPVRRRKMTGSAWTVVQPVEKAAATVERFLRERPDLV